MAVRLKLRQVFSVDNGEVKLVEDVLCDGALLADLEHVRVHVTHRDCDGELLRRVFLRLRKDAEGDVTRASGDVEAPQRLGLNDLASIIKHLARFERTDLRDEVILPEAMHTERHRVIHQVVAVGNAGEHVVHFSLLLVFGNVLEAKVNLFLALLREMPQPTQPDGGSHVLRADGRKA